MKFVFLFLKILLYPIMLLLNVIIYVRNWLYDNRILKSVQPNIFTINVGNLNLGGTGKTPHVEYLVRMLANSYQTTILSRGYGRKTKGFIKADGTAAAQTIGDEPMQYYLKFKEKINVVVCEDRIKGVEKIQSQILDNQLVILDDAFQHRKISPHLNLLLCDYNRPFYEDNLVPVGKLRDMRKSANRANAVIVTKCPKNITAQKYKEIKDGINAYVLPETPIFFSRIAYQTILGYSSENTFKLQELCILITGIAKPEIFVKYIIDEKIKVIHTHNFRDHYAFSRNDIENIITETNNFKTTSQIITTEKDMVKLKPLLNEQELNHFFFVPIEVEIEEKVDFEAFIFNRIQTFNMK